MYKNNNAYLSYLFFISLVARKHAILVSGHGMDSLFIDYKTGVYPDGQSQSKNPKNYNSIFWIISEGKNPYVTEQIFYFKSTGKPAHAAMHSPHSVFDIGHVTVLHCDAGRCLTNGKTEKN